jgi:surface polysaccharide O-acyltransferase-like enzyme
LFPFVTIAALLLVPTRLMAETWHPALAEHVGEMARDLIWTPLRQFYVAAVIMALLGLARRLKPSRSALLTYLSGGVFCFYIVHQTVIVAAGYVLAPLGWPAPVEAAVLIGSTFAACLISYEVFRRIPVLRALFGITPTRKKD